MSDILTKIEAYKREEIAAAKRAHPLASLEALAKAAPAPRGFVRAIREKLAHGEYALDRRSEEGIALQGPDPRRFRSARSGAAPIRPAARPVSRC